MLTKAQAVEKVRQERKGREHAPTRDEMNEPLERLTEGHLTDSELAVAEALPAQL